MLTQLFENLIPNFSLTGRFISFELPKQLLVCVVMAKPHPYVVSNAFPSTCRPHTFCLIAFLLTFLDKMTSCGCGYVKSTPNTMPTYV